MAEAKSQKKQEKTIAARQGEIDAAQANLTRTLNSLQNDVDNFLSTIMTREFVESRKDTIHGSDEIARTVRDDFVLDILSAQGAKQLKVLDPTAADLVDYLPNAYLARIDYDSHPSLNDASWFFTDDVVTDGNRLFLKPNIQTLTPVAYEGETQQELQAMAAQLGIANIPQLLEYTSTPWVYKFKGFQVSTEPVGTTTQQQIAALGVIDKFQNSLDVQAKVFGRRDIKESDLLSKSKEIPNLIRKLEGFGNVGESLTVTQSKINVLLGSTPVMSGPERDPSNTNLYYFNGQIPQIEKVAENLILGARRLRTEGDGGITHEHRKAVYKILQNLLLEQVPVGEEEELRVIEESFKDVFDRLEQENQDPSTNLRQTDLEDNWRFDPQAYLYYQISKVSAARLLRVPQGSKSHFKNIMLAEVRPSIVNNLFAAANEKKMLDLTTVQASHIMPKVKIFSVKRFGNGSVKEKQIKFDTNLTRADIANIFQGKRGGGVGLQEVEINFQGTDLVSVDKLFSVDLTLFIQDAEKVTESNLDTHFLRLIEYKVKSSKDRKAYDEELRLEIGWSVDDSSGNLFTRAMRREVESNRISLLMGLKDHTFTVNPDGTLNLKAEYVGRLENLFSSRDADIFPVQDSRSLSELYRQKREIESDSFGEEYAEAYRETDQGSELEDSDLEVQASNAARKIKIKKITQINNQRKEILRSRYESIMDALLSRGLIYQTYVTSDAQERFRDYCQLSVLENENRQVIRTDDNLVITQSDSMPNPGNQGHLVNFFYFGDFLDVAIDAMHDTKTSTNQPNVQKNKKYEFMLGMVPTVSPGVNPAGAEKKTLHNLALMPITVATYMEWFKKNVDEKGRVNYAFFDFIKDVSNDLIFKVLGGNYFSQSERMKPPISKLSINNFTLNSSSKIFKKSSKIITEKDLRKRDLSPSNQTAKSLREVFFLYALPTLGSSGYMSGKKKEDAANGIYHISVGRDKGVLKEINFAKANIQGWRESQTLKSVEGKDNVFATAPYNCDIRMIGNTMFKPGMTIFVDPLISGFGSVASANSIARKLEIGGYYTILGAAHYVRGTMFETSLRCVYNSVPSDPDSSNKEDMVTIKAVSLRQQKVAAADALVDSYIPGGSTE